jgi:hypothetical protein
MEKLSEAHDVTVVSLHKSIEHVSDEKHEEKKVRANDFVIKPVVERVASRVF